MPLSQIELDQRAKHVNIMDAIYTLERNRIANSAARAIRIAKHEADIARIIAERETPFASVPGLLPELIKTPLGAAGVEADAIKPPLSRIELDRNAEFEQIMLSIPERIRKFRQERDERELRHAALAIEKARIIAERETPFASVPGLLPELIKTPIGAAGVEADAINDAAGSATGVESDDVGYAAPATPGVSAYAELARENAELREAAAARLARDRALPQSELDRRAEFDRAQSESDRERRRRELDEFVRAEAARSAEVVRAAVAQFALDSGDDTAAAVGPAARLSPETHPTGPRLAPDTRVSDR